MNKVNNINKKEMQHTERYELTAIVLCIQMLEKNSILEMTVFKKLEISKIIQKQMHEHLANFYKSSILENLFL